MFLQSPQSTCTIIVTKLDKGEANPMTSFCFSYGTSTISEPLEILCFYLGEVKNQRYSHIHVENYVFLSE